jgi:hypothetical protein
MAREWLSKHFQIKPEVKQIFDDLEAFKNFCRDYGYPYDERQLYNERGAYGEFLKLKQGKEPWDQWRTPRRDRAQ